MFSGVDFQPPNIQPNCPKHHYYSRKYSTFHCFCRPLILVHGQVRNSPSSRVDLRSRELCSLPHNREPIWSSDMTPSLSKSEKRLTYAFLLVSREIYSSQKK